MVLLKWVDQTTKIKVLMLSRMLLISLHMGASSGDQQKMQYDSR